MIMRSRRNNSHDIQASVDTLIAALDNAGLDKKTTLVLGGGALAFAGIRPAGDLDVMVSGKEFKYMEKQRKTPGGLYVLRNEEVRNDPFLKAYDTPNHRLLLPTDITYPHGPSDTIHPAREKEFRDALDSFDEIDGYRYLPSQIVAEHKSSLPRPRRKDRQDVQLIGRHLIGKGHFGR